MAGRLIIVCQHVADARNAEAGGADGIVLVGSRDGGGLSPAPDVVRDVRRAVVVDVRPLVKLRDGYSTDGGEATRLRGLIADYRSCGADGMVMGFLNGRSEVDTEVLDLLLSDGEWPWTFHRGFDACLETARAWRSLMALPRCDSVVTAGSVRDVEHGLDDLIRRARSDARIAALMQAGGDLQPEHVPWLARAGVSRFQIGTSVRPGRSWKAYVDPGLVRSWRSLIDDEVPHNSPGRPPHESSLTDPPGSVDEGDQ
jgi:copper homeostasis protein